jgi:hypothetical protein
VSFTAPHPNLYRSDEILYHIPFKTNPTVKILGNTVVFMESLRDKVKKLTTCSRNITELYYTTLNCHNLSLQRPAPYLSALPTALLAVLLCSLCLQIQRMELPRFASSSLSFDTALNYEKASAEDDNFTSKPYLTDLLLVSPYLW